MKKKLVNQNLKFINLQKVEGVSGIHTNEFRKEGSDIHFFQNKEDNKVNFQDKIEIQYFSNNSLPQIDKKIQFCIPYMAFTRGNSNPSLWQDISKHILLNKTKNAINQKSINKYDENDVCKIYDDNKELNVPSHKKFKFLFNYTIEKEIQTNNLKKIAQKYLTEKKYLIRQFSKPFTYRSLKMFKAVLDNKNEIVKFKLRPVTNTKSIDEENSANILNLNKIQIKGKVKSIKNVKKGIKSLTILPPNLMEYDLMDENLDNLSSFSCSCHNCGGKNYRKIQVKMHFNQIEPIISNKMQVNKSKKEKILIRNKTKIVDDKTIGNYTNSKFSNLSIKNNKKMGRITFNQKKSPNNNFQIVNKDFKKDIFDTQKSMQFKDLLYLNSISSNHYFKHRNFDQVNRASQVTQTFLSKNSSDYQITNPNKTSISQSFNS